MKVVGRRASLALTILATVFGIMTTCVDAADVPIRIAAIGSFDSFNPFILRGVTPAGINRLWLPLMRQSAYHANVLRPAIAINMVLSKDRRRLTFDLNPRAVFSNGSPVTAADVLWTFRTLIAQGDPFFRSYYRMIQSMTAAGKHCVVFHLAAHAPASAAANIATEPILPRAFWIGRKFDTLLRTPPPASGPYRISAFQMGTRITYVRVPHWWGDGLPGQSERDTIGHLTYVYFGNRAVALQAFRAGVIDLWRIDQPREGRALAGLQGVEVASFPISLPAGMHGFAFNLRKKVLQQRPLRHGLALMFDFSWMNRVLFGGAYKRNRSFFANSALAARTGVPYLPTNGAYGVNNATRIEAVKLIERANYHLDHGVMVDARGDPLRLVIPIDQPELEAPLMVYRAALSSIGVRLRVVMLDPAAYQARLDRWDYDLAYDVIPQPEQPGAAEADYFGCSAAKRPGSNNLSGLCSRKIDNLIAVLSDASSRYSRVKAARALDRSLRRLWIMIPGWYRSTVKIAYRSVLIPPKRAPRDGFDLALWHVR